MSRLEGKALRNAMLLETRNPMLESIKAENVGEAPLRAEVICEAQTMGDVASLAAMCTEPFSSEGAQPRNFLASLPGYLQRRKQE